MNDFNLPREQLIPEDIDRRTPTPMASFGSRVDGDISSSYHLEAPALVGVHDRPSFDSIDSVTPLSSSWVAGGARPKHVKDYASNKYIEPARMKTVSV